jgi:uncharacterized protein (DUF3820 family)
VARPKTAILGSTLLVVLAVLLVLAWPATAQATTRYEQNNTRLSYMGTWYANNAAPSASGGSFKYTDVAGASLRIDFTGTYLAWVSKIGLVYGYAEVYLDGADQGAVNLYSAGTAWQQTVWSTGTLASGAHTVVIVCNGAGYIGADAFDICGTLTQAPALTRYEQNNTKLSYGGTWYSNNAAPSASGGSFKYSNSGSAMIRIDFTGNYLAWVTKKGPAYGAANVFVDGAYQGVVNLYNASDTWQQTVWNTGTLATGAHTVVIGCFSSSYIGVDAFDIWGTLTQAPAYTRYQQNNTKLVYTGTWYSNNAAPSASGGSFKYTNVTGASVTVHFTGNYLRWVAKQGPAYGIASVTLDGVDMGTVDLYWPTDNWQWTVWSTVFLTSPGAHTLVITCTGTKRAAATNTYIGVDAFDVWGTLN